MTLVSAIRLVRKGKETICNEINDHQLKKIHSVVRFRFCFKKKEENEWHRTRISKETNVKTTVSVNATLAAVPMNRRGDRREHFVLILEDWQGGSRHHRSSTSSVRRCSRMCNVHSSTTRNDWPPQPENTFLFSAFETNEKSRRWRSDNELNFHFLCNDCAEDEN